MEKIIYPAIHINIYGGNNQILPNATKAEQHFYFTAEEVRPTNRPLQPHTWNPDDEKRFSLYIDKKEELSAYIATLAACKTAREVGCAPTTPNSTAVLFQRKSSSGSFSRFSPESARAKA